ncbi:hypothetical protein [Streptomyces ardesiacus]|uniref:hypothetical protein n=1 Tax=Streptomyces ardesiacus TaxID=285564 RepID=UPI00340FB779
MKQTMTAAQVQAAIIAELPRRTGMYIDPNERWDARATQAALQALDDEDVVVRRNWLLTSCADMPKRHEAALYEYSIHLSREMNRRHIGVTGGAR